MESLTANARLFCWCYVGSSRRPNPKISTKSRPRKCGWKLSAQLNNSQDPQQQQLNLSVLCFTFGIPGLDESYLSRYIGLAFGSLLILNHFAGPDSVTYPQLRTEAMGLCLAAFSVSLPYIGKFLKALEILHKGSLSLLIQPLCRDPNPPSTELYVGGLILLVSNVSNAYGEKDRVWIRAAGNKFLGWADSSPDG